MSPGCRPQFQPADPAAVARATAAAAGDTTPTASSSRAASRGGFFSNLFKQNK